MLTIVMYHYVRDVADGPFSGLKVRTRREFLAQLDFIDARYRVARMEDVAAAQRGEGRLPDNACLLTFDDGYREHAEFVAPALAARGWQGSFFPVVDAVQRRCMLAANQLHFMLAAGADVDLIVRRVMSAIDDWKGEPRLPPASGLYSAHAVASRFDPAPIVFLKRMLQRELPAGLRAALLEELFAQFVSRSPAAFADELYLSLEHLRQMHGAGMHVGVHGRSHRWLDALDDTEQAAEIDDGLALLGMIGAPRRDWSMAYPYGAYNGCTLKLLRQRGCAVGLTTRVAIADIAADPPLLLPRMDTNDLCGNAHAVGPSADPIRRGDAGPAAADAPACGPCLDRDSAAGAAGVRGVHIEPEQQRHL